MKILEVRKEENYYFQGPFWIIADSFINILKGNFELLSEKYLSDYEGKYIDDNSSKTSKTHKQLWKSKLSSKFNDEYDYDYFPRGRVSIYRRFLRIHPSSISGVMNQYLLFFFVKYGNFYLHFLYI